MPEYDIDVDGDVTETSVSGDTSNVSGDILDYEYHVLELMSFKKNECIRQSFKRK